MAKLFVATLTFHTPTSTISTMTFLLYLPVYQRNMCSLIQSGKISNFNFATTDFEVSAGHRSMADGKPWPLEILVEFENNTF